MKTLCTCFVLVLIIPRGRCNFAKGTAPGCQSAVFNRPWINLICHNSFTFKTRLVTDTSTEHAKIQHRCDRREEKDLLPN